MDDVRVVGIADVIKAKAEATAAQVGAKAYGNHLDMLAAEKPDVVWVSSPNWLHAQHAVDVAQAKAHVMSEKPMALSLHDCDRMIAAARANGVKLNVAQTTRYILPLVEMERVFRSGRCGALVCATSVRMSYHVPREECLWRLEHETSGSIVFEWEIHEIDFVRSIGGTVTHVYARTVNSRPEAPTFLDHFSAVLTFEQGGFGHLDASQSCHLGDSGRYFVGTKGSAKAVGADSVQLKTLDMAQAEMIQVQDDGMKTQARQDADFIRAIREDAPAPVPGEDARVNVEIAAAIIESGTTGSVVTLPL